MEKNLINEFIDSSFDNIAALIDSSKILGTPIQIGDFKYLIPISKVSFGFGLGGSERKKGNDKKKKLSFENSLDLYPYGGTIGGVSISPEAFLIVSKEKSEIIYMDKDPTLFQMLLEMFTKVFK